jgi:hypothetical protein
METPEERGTPAQGKSIIEKLKERQGFSKRKLMLAQKGSEDEAFWDGHVDGLAVAILIVECEQ